MWDRRVSGVLGVERARHGEYTLSMRYALFLLLLPLAAQAQWVRVPSNYVEVSNTVATEARIVGQTVDVSIIGTVALDGASLETLNEPQCPPLSMGRTGVDGTVRTVPVSAEANRTKLFVVNHSNSGYLACRTGPSVGFTSPVCTTAAAGATQEGVRLDPSASLALDVTASTLLRCINCTAVGAPAGTTAQVSFMEQNCL